MGKYIFDWLEKNKIIAVILLLLVFLIFLVVLLQKRPVEIGSVKIGTVPFSEETKVSNPPINNPKQLSREVVRDLAKRYRLIDHGWKVNPHLQFEEGDISYWYEKGLTTDALKREFKSRYIVLKNAETTGEVIKTQGDLSYKVEMEMQKKETDK